MSMSQAHQLLAASNKANKVRCLSREEIINKMENEQDAIVIKLLREIDQLKRENNYLRSTINYLNKRQNSSNSNTNNSKSNNNNDTSNHRNETHLPVFESDDESAIIIDNVNLNLYTPSHSRHSSISKGSITSNIEGHNYLSSHADVSGDYVTTTTINNINGDIMDNRRRRRTSSSVYHNIRRTVLF